MNISQALPEWKWDPILVEESEMGKTLDLFPGMVASTMEYQMKSLSIRSLKKWKRLAVKDTNGKIHYITEYFSYISPIHFADNGQYQYFYAGNGDEVSLYVLSLETYGMVTKKIEGISFSLKEIPEGKYIGNGIIEYMILWEKIDKTDKWIAWTTKFVDMEIYRGYEFSDFSFEGIRPAYRHNENIYIIGISSDAPSENGYSSANCRCVLAFPEIWGENPTIFWGKWLGNITPMLDEGRKVIGFEGNYMTGNNKMENTRISLINKKYLQ